MARRIRGAATDLCDADGNPPYRLLQQQRLTGTAHSGNACEWLQIEASGGPQVYFAHDVGRPRIIEELAPSLWVKSDRSGPYLAIRVVLPRTLDPQTGQPMSTILTGPPYTGLGRWQQLRLSGIPTLLMRQVHVLRMQFGPQVDDCEAYVDAVLLNVYGGPGVTNVWIDDLDIPGHVALVAGQSQLQPIRTPPVTNITAAGPLVPVRLPPVGLTLPRGLTPGGATGFASALPPRRRIQLDEDVLTVNDRAMFPRIIQHRGEPLATLKGLGFNAVWLPRIPAPEQLEEADRLGLWLICPPPRELTPDAEIGPAFDSVLAWDLGSDLIETDLEATQHWADQVRGADRRVNRPLVCRPRVDLRGYSRAADMLLIDRRPLGTSLELTEYATWLRRQPLLAAAATPVWTTVQTQPNEALRQQLVAMEPNSAPPLCVSSEQVRLLVATAVTSGSRGLLFLSDSPLDATDAETQQRATTLQLVNLELEIMEPWAAQGSLTNLEVEVTQPKAAQGRPVGAADSKAALGKSAAAAESVVPEVSGAILRTKTTHARLLLPIWTAARSQYVVPQAAANALALLLPGVPEGNEAYELTPSGVQSLRPIRGNGGLRITLPEFGLATQILLAHDPSIVGEVSRRAAESGRRSAQLQQRLAALKLTSVQRLAGQLATRISVPPAAMWLETARKNLQSCDSQLASGDVTQAAQNAQRAMRSLRLVERAYWDAAVKPLNSPVSSPGAVSFDTLPWHLRFVGRVDPSVGHRFGPNRIAGGDFEDLDTMMRAGWRYLQHAPPSLQTAVDLTPDAARSGRLGLRLAVVAVNPQKPPAVVESPPILFTSPSVQVEAGQIVCIYGWVKITSPITGSNDGLLIVDSLAGETLADRIGPTEGWRQFYLYRVAPQSGPMCVTFALSGMGEARLDDVAIQVLDGR